MVFYCNFKCKQDLRYPLVEHSYSNIHFFVPCMSVASYHSHYFTKCSTIMYETNVVNNVVVHNKYTERNVTCVQVVIEVNKSCPYS